MKGILLILPILLLLPSLVSADTYYVTQHGDGDYSGSTYINAMSVSDHNGHSFSGDDIIYLCDTITSKVVPPSSGTSDHVITYRGDYAGHAGIIDRNGGFNGIEVTTKDYLVFQSIEITDWSGGSAAIQIYNGCDYVTVKNCVIHDGTYRGIFISGGGGGSPCSYITIGGASGDGNTIYNIGEDHTACSDVSMNACTDIIISHNTLHGDSTHGIDGVGFENCKRVLIEYNTMYDHNQIGQGENGIDVKKLSEDIIIRFNNIYGHDREGGIHVQMDSHDVCIYGNKINNNEMGVLVMDNAATTDWPSNAYNPHNIQIWGNLIYDNDLDGVVITTSGGQAPTDITVVNNVIAENGVDATMSSQGHGVRIRSGSNHVVKNNIFYKNRPNEADHVQSYYEVTGVDLNYNQYYWPGQTSYVYWGGASRNIATLASSYNQEVNGVDGDPGFTNAGSDYTLTEASPCKDTGVNLSGLAASYTIQGTTYDMYYDNCLDDSYVDFSTTPPTARTADQDNYGSGWERGAYVYTGDDPQDTCESLSGHCCILPDTCPGTEIGTFTDCSGTCCDQACQSHPEDTCTGLGYHCCLACVSGTEHPENDTDCSPQVCCGECVSAPPVLGIVGHWTFDIGDISGDQALDLSGFGNSGTIHGATPVTGRIGEALMFNGIDDYIDFGDNVEPTDEISFSAWVLPEGDQTNSVILAKYSVIPAEYEMMIGNAGTYVTRSDNGPSYNSTILARDPNHHTSYPGWVHVTGTYGADMMMKIFVNGELKASGDMFTRDTSRDDPLTIGKRSYPGAEAFFNGIIDDVMIWNRSLSATEILDLYDSAFHMADDNPRDGCIEEHELIPFIDLWMQDSTANPMGEVMEAVTMYYSPEAWC